MWLIDLAKILLLPSFSSLSSPLAEEKGEDFFASFLSSLLTSLNADTFKKNSGGGKSGSSPSSPSYLFSLKLLKELGDILRKNKIQLNEKSSRKITSDTKNPPSTERQGLSECAAVCTPQKSLLGERENEKSLHSQILLNEDVSSLSSFLKAAFTFSSSCQSLFLLTELSFPHDALMRRGVRTPQNVQRGTKTGTVIDSSSSAFSSKGTGSVKRESFHSTSSSFLSEAVGRRRRRLRPSISASSGTCLVTSDEEEEDEEAASRNEARTPLHTSSSSFSISQGTEDVSSPPSLCSVCSSANLDFREIVVKGRENYLELELNLRHRLLLLILNILRRYLPSLHQHTSSSSSSAAVVDCVRDKERSLSSSSCFPSVQGERHRGDDGWSETCDHEKRQKETGGEREKKSSACGRLFLESKEDWVLFFKALVTSMEAVYVHLLTLRDELTLLPGGDHHPHPHRPSIQGSLHRSLRQEKTFSNRFNEDKQNSISCRSLPSAVHSSGEIDWGIARDISSSLFIKRRTESSFTSPSSAAEILRCIDALASLECEKKNEKNLSILLHFLRSLQDLLHEALRYLSSSPHASLEKSLIESAAIAEENRLLTFIQLLQPLTIAGAVYIHLPPSPRTDDLLSTSVSSLPSDSSRREPARASLSFLLSSHSSTTSSSPSSSSSSFYETSTDVDFRDDRAFFLLPLERAQRGRRHGGGGVGTAHQPGQSECERSSHPSSPASNQRFSERRESEEEDFKRISTAWRSAGISSSSSSCACRRLSSHATRGEETSSSSSSPSSLALRKTPWRARPRGERERTSDHGEREEEREEPHQERSRRRKAEYKKVRTCGRKEGRGRGLESHRNRLRCISLHCIQLAIRLSPKSLFRSWPLILSPPQGFKIDFSFFASSSSSSRSTSSSSHISGLCLGSSVLQRDGIDSDIYHKGKEVKTLARSNHTYLTPPSSSTWCTYTSKPRPSAASPSSPPSSLLLSPSSSPSRQIQKFRLPSTSSSSSLSHPSLSSGQWAASYLLVDTRFTRLSLHQRLWMSIVRLDADVKVRRSAIDCLVTLLETSPLNRWPAAALEPCGTSSSSSSSFSRPSQEGRSSSSLSLHSFFPQPTNLLLSSSAGREILQRKHVDSLSSSSSFLTRDLPFLHSRTCSLLIERSEILMYVLWLWRRKTDDKQNYSSFLPSDTSTSSSSSLLPSSSSSSSSSSYPYLLRKGGLASSFNTLSGSLFSSTRLIIFHLFALTEDLCRSIHLLLFSLTLSSSSSFSPSSPVLHSTSLSVESCCLSSASGKDMIKSYPSQIVELHYHQSLMSLEIPLRALTRLVRTLPLTAFRPGVLLACLRLVYPFFLGFLKYLLSQSLRFSSSSSSLQSLKKLIECFLLVRRDPPSENLYVKYAEKAVEIFSLFPRDSATSSSSSSCANLIERRENDDRLIHETTRRQREEEEQQNKKEEKEEEGEYAKTSQQKADEDRRTDGSTADISSSIVLTSFHVSILSAATALMASIVSIKPFRFEVLEGFLLNLSLEKGKSLHLERKTAFQLHPGDTSNSSSSLRRPDNGVYVQPERRDETEGGKTDAVSHGREGKKDESLDFSEKKERETLDRVSKDDERELPHFERISPFHVEDLSLIDVLLFISCILVSTESSLSSSSLSSSSCSSALFLPGMRRREGLACTSGEKEEEEEQEERLEDTSKQRIVKKKKKKEEGKEDTDNEEEAEETERIERRKHGFGVWRVTLRDMFLNLLSRRISKTYAEVFILSFLLQTSSSHTQKTERTPSLSSSSSSPPLVLLLLKLLLSSSCSLSPQGETSWHDKLQGLSLAIDLLSVFPLDDGSSHACTQDRDEEEIDEKERGKNEEEEEENEECEEGRFPDDRKAHEEKERGRDSGVHAVYQQKEKKIEREEKKNRSPTTDQLMMMMCCLSSSSSWCCCTPVKSRREAEEAEEESSEEEDRNSGRGKMKRTARRRRARCLRREILDLVWQHVWCPLFFVDGFEEENEQEKEKEEKNRNEEKYENGTPVRENFTDKNSSEACQDISLSSSSSSSLYLSSHRPGSEFIEEHEHRDKESEVQEKKEEEEEDRCEADETRERELPKENEDRKEKEEQEEEEEEYSTYVVTACEALHLLRYEDWELYYPSFLQPTFGYELASLLHPSKPPVSILTERPYLSLMAAKKSEEEEQRRKRKSILTRKKRQEKVEKKTSIPTDSSDRRAFMEASSSTFSNASSLQDSEEEKKKKKKSGAILSSSFSSSSPSPPDSCACVSSSHDDFYQGHDENEREREEEKQRRCVSSSSSPARDAEEESGRREEEKEAKEEKKLEKDDDDEDDDDSKKKKKRSRVLFSKHHEEEKSRRCLYTSKLSESMELALIETGGLYIRYTNIYRRSYCSSPSCLEKIRKREDQTCFLHEEVETGERTHDVKEVEEENEKEEEDQQKERQKKEAKCTTLEQMKGEKKRLERRVQEEQEMIELQLRLSRLACLCSLAALFSRCLLFRDLSPSPSVRVFSSCERRFCLLLKIFSDIYSSSSFCSSSSSVHTKSRHPKKTSSSDISPFHEEIFSSSSCLSPESLSYLECEELSYLQGLLEALPNLHLFFLLSSMEEARRGEEVEEEILMKETTTMTTGEVVAPSLPSSSVKPPSALLRTNSIRALGSVCGMYDWMKGTSSSSFSSSSFSSFHGRDTLWRLGERDSHELRSHFMRRPSDGSTQGLYTCVQRVHQFFLLFLNVPVERRRRRKFFSHDARQKKGDSQEVEGGRGRREGGEEEENKTLARTDHSDGEEEEQGEERTKARREERGGEEQGGGREENDGGEKKEKEEEKDKNEGDSPRGEVSSLAFHEGGRTRREGKREVEMHRKEKEKKDGEKEKTSFRDLKEDKHDRDPLHNGKKKKKIDEDLSKNKGKIKMQWNACYSIRLLYNNPTFIRAFASQVPCRASPPAPPLSRSSSPVLPDPSELFPQKIFSRYRSGMLLGLSCCLQFSSSFKVRIQATSTLQVLLSSSTSFFSSSSLPRRWSVTEQPTQLHALFERERPRTNEQSVFPLDLSSSFSSSSSFRKEEEDENFIGSVWRDLREDLFVDFRPKDIKVVWRAIAMAASSFSLSEGNKRVNERKERYKEEKEKEKEQDGEEEEACHDEDISEEREKNDTKKYLGEALPSSSSSSCRSRASVFLLERYQRQLREKLELLLLEEDSLLLPLTLLFFFSFLSALERREEGEVRNSCDDETIPSSSFSSFSSSSCSSSSSSSLEEDFKEITYTLDDVDSLGNGVHAEVSTPCYSSSILFRREEENSSSPSDEKEEEEEDFLNVIHGALKDIIARELLRLPLLSSSSLPSSSSSSSSSAKDQSPEMAYSLSFSQSNSRDSSSASSSSASSSSSVPLPGNLSFDREKEEETKKEEKKKETSSPSSLGIEEEEEEGEIKEKKKKINSTTTMKEDKRKTAMMNTCEKRRGREHPPYRETFYLLLSLEKFRLQKKRKDDKEKTQEIS